MSVSVESVSAQQGTLLDAADLDALFLDLADMADICDVQFEDGAQALMSKRPQSLGDAHEALRQGQVPGVQIHYFFQGDAWWDTVLRTDEGFRLTRQHLSLSELVSPAFTVVQSQGLLTSSSVGTLENLVTA